MAKTLPPMNSDAEAEALLDQDLSDYLHSGNFKPITFEFLPKDEKVNLRLATPLLDNIRKKAEAEGVPYQKYIRLVLERDVMLDNRAE
jgi:predicted DNA binding CopG/RHH family protein